MGREETRTLTRISLAAREHRERKHYMTCEPPNKKKLSALKLKLITKQQPRLISQSANGRSACGGRILAMAIVGNYGMSKTCPPI